MRWPLPRPVYLTLENDDIDLKPLGVEELLPCLSAPYSLRRPWAQR